MKMVWRAIFGISLVFAAQVASSSPASEAFDEFQKRCVAKVVDGDAHALDDLQAVPRKNIRNVLVFLGASTNQADNTEIWFTSSDRFFLFTKVGEDAFCQLVGFQVDFPDMKSAFLGWQEKFGGGYRSDREFEIRSVNPLTLNKQVAGVYMAKPTEDGGVLQVFVQYRPDYKQGFASILLVRLKEMSPAAKELFQE